jgi:hypothetical protein
MSPLPGIYASQITGHLVTNSFESIATVTVGAGGTSTISFTSIPSTYKHLQLRYISNNTAAAYYILLRFNSDSGTNYSSHQLTGNGTSVSASAGVSNTQIELPRNSGTFNSSIMSVGIADILDYANTSKYKTVRALGGYDTNGNGQAVDFNSGAWLNTTAVNSITLSAIAGNYNTYSQFALYGIRG